jgi:hypothetical protein
LHPLWGRKRSRVAVEEIPGLTVVLLIPDNLDPTDMRINQNSFLAFVALLLFGTCTDSAPENKRLVSRVYNEQTFTGELAYLKSIDFDKLTDVLQAAVTVRKEELELARQLLAVDPNIVITGVRCDRGPVLPCPRLDDGAVSFPIGTQIELDLIGVFMEEVTNPQARLMLNEGTAQLVTTDGKKIFAQGALVVFDSLFQTAWYGFDVKNRALASAPLVLKLTTQVIVNQQVKPVAIDKPIPAGTFLGDNLH